MEQKTEASQACPKNFGHPHDYSLREDGKCAYCQHDEEASQAVDEPVLPHLPRAVGYRHTMDNTEGLKGNKPVAVFCVTKPNPFGIPGLDYSASFPVTTETLFTADQMKAYARAALKAQPAPTDPYQLDDDDDARFPNDTNVVILHIDRYWHLRGCEDICAALDAKPAPTEAAQVTIERGGVYITKGVQSFRLAYEGETQAEKEWYAGQLRAALGQLSGNSTEAAQGSFLVRVTPMNPEYAEVHPELALEDALRVIPYGWPDGFQFEVVVAQPDRHALQAEGKHPAPCARHCEATAFDIEIRRLTAENSQLRAAQGAQPSGNTGELAQGEDSARLDAERYQWLCAEFGVTWLPALLESWLKADYIADGKVSIDAAIDRARASAETGGVKP